MPYTVNMSFKQFRENYVDLDADDVATARRSRDYLQGQIANVASKDSTFPILYGGYKPFGSFARSTKVRPLNDIDMLVLLNGKDTASSWDSGYIYNIKVNNTNSILWQYTNQNDNYLNSTRILNKFKSALANVPNYRKADIKRNGVAVVLDLTSYSWVFDIVPAFPVSDGNEGTDYYLIPNGSGKWTRTDPRRDQKNITDANKYHNNNLIPLIRLIKYWNERSHSPPTIPSYYLETMLINGLRYSTPITSIKESIPSAFRQLSSQVLSSCPDPKSLGPNLDADISWDTKKKVSEAAATMAKYANYALDYEKKEDHKNAIMWWGYIFPGFPAYGS